MLNSRPIFINGLSRSGTTILTNLLASHPDICLLGETHHAFKGTSITDSRWHVVRKCVRNDLLVLLLHRQDFFSPRLLASRKPLSATMERHIDRVLFREKLRSMHPALNQFRAPQVKYTGQEVADGRVLCKNIDGMMLANDAWSAMYPDATFLGLVRHGLAVCEGHVRRGRSAREIGMRYQLLVDRMLRDADTIPRYAVVRFEDLVGAPEATLRHVCDHVEVELQGMPYIRMQVRRAMDANGCHRLLGQSEWQVNWYRLDELGRFLERDVDQNQIKRLSPRDRDEFLKQAGVALERLGYSTSAASSCEDSGEPGVSTLAFPQSDEIIRRAA